MKVKFIQDVPNGGISVGKVREFINSLPKQVDDAEFQLEFDEYTDEQSITVTFHPIEVAPIDCGDHIPSQVTDYPQDILLVTHTHNDQQITP